MSKKKHTVLLWLLLYILCSSTATYAVQRASPESLNKRAIARLQTFLSGMQKIAVEFEQRDQFGLQAKGMLLVDKPYRFRCNYYAPYPLLIVGGKSYLSIYDYEMNTLARVDAKENILYFLLIDKANLQREFTVLYCKELNNTYELMLRNQKLENNILVRFKKLTGEIAYIKIFESNNEIMLTFSNFKFLKQIDRNLFTLRDPELFDKPKRLTKQDVAALIR